MKTQIRIAVLIFSCGAGALAAAASPPPPVAVADKAAILAQAKLTADAKGLVENECGERVAPKFVSIDLGGAAGPAVLFVMEGGPNTAACYGDGPDLHLMRKDAKGYQEIFSLRGGFLVLMPAKGAAARDIAQGGPGMTAPLWRWNGRTYAPTGSVVTERQMQGASYYP